MLTGRLGLETARVPHVDRHGLLWLSRGNLTVRNGVLYFLRKAKRDADGVFEPGGYEIPFQMVSIILLGPGSTVSHDALRLLARHGTALAAVGENGVRSYTAPPLVADQSKLARRQATVWANEKSRLEIARRMYAWRLGEVLPHREIAVLRGIEGARMKKSYASIAEETGIEWHGRRLHRDQPWTADLANQALNHAASAAAAAAAIAVSATATIPQLGFIHEDSGQSFVLDIADLFRDTMTIPVAFKAAAKAQKSPSIDVERLARRSMASALSNGRIIARMIDRIKELLS